METTTDSAANQSRKDLRILAFPVMWGLAHISHLWTHNLPGMDGLSEWLTLLAAVWLILKPNSQMRLLALAAAQIFDVWVQTPFAPDHWVLVGAVNLAILVTTTTRAGRQNGILSVAMPAIRTATVFAYSAAALAKYNTTFLDPVTSCAHYLARAATFDLIDLSPLAPLLVVMAIAAETLVPILLIIPATRRYGARIGVTFHFLVSLSPAMKVADFTTTLFALFALFLSKQDFNRGLELATRFASKSDIIRRAREKPIPAALIATGLAGGVGFANPAVSSGFLFAFETLYGLIVVSALLGTAFNWAKTAPWGLPRLAHVPVFLLLLIPISSPYLGLRTMGVFTMFSGLRTEGPGTNHLFLPSLHLTNYQTEIFYPQQTNDNGFQNLVDTKQAVPFMEVRRRLDADPEIELAGLLNDRPVSFSPENREGFQPPAWWEKKFLTFRPFPADGGVSHCTN